MQLDWGHQTAVACAWLVLALNCNRGLNQRDIEECVSSGVIDPPTFIVAIQHFPEAWEGAFQLHSKAFFPMQCQKCKTLIFDITALMISLPIGPPTHGPSFVGRTTAVNGSSDPGMVGVNFSTSSAWLPETTQTARLGYQQITKSIIGVCDCF